MRCLRQQQNRQLLLPGPCLVPDRQSWLEHSILQPVPGPSSRAETLPGNCPNKHRDSQSIQNWRFSRCVPFKDLSSISVATPSPLATYEVALPTVGCHDNDRDRPPQDDS